MIKIKIVISQTRDMTVNVICHSAQLCYCHVEQTKAEPALEDVTDDSEHDGEQSESETLSGSTLSLQ